MNSCRACKSYCGAAALSAILLFYGRCGRDELARILARKRSIPGISFIRDYADNHDYINALANSVRASFAKHGEPDLLLLFIMAFPALCR